MVEMTIKVLSGLTAMVAVREAVHLFEDKADGYPEAFRGTPKKKKPAKKTTKRRRA